MSAPRPGRRGPDHSDDRRRARRSGSCPRPSRCQREVLVQPPRFLVQELALHRQVADLGLQSHHVFVTRVWLPRLQRRLTAGEKVITPSRHRGSGDPSSRETTSMSSPRSNRRMALVLRRAEKRPRSSYLLRRLRISRTTSCHREASTRIGGLLSEYRRVRLAA
jgi:hypothetical protein